MINFATLLTQQQVERTHAASLEILENVGVLVRNEKARTIFNQHGCREEAGTQIIKFPPALVEKYRAMLPHTFTFYGRDSRYDRTIPQDGPVIVTGSSAPDIIDPVTGRARRASPGNTSPRPAYRCAAPRCPFDRPAPVVHHHVGEWQQQRGQV